MVEGLRTIVENYEAQVGRPLAADELASITRTARSFFDARLSSSSSTTFHPIQHAPGQQPQSAPRDAGDAAKSSTEPPYPADFFALAKLISASSTSDNPNELLQSLMNQNQLPLDGLKTIPNKLNDQKPDPPVLATQGGAGKKPWEATLGHHLLKHP
ncbi:uncharacterized protein VP01_48g1 [Puccinia sorghi]|uniref:Peroxisomal membrane protein PEX14-like KPWE domain-containing protein n=1 Tax=Puccinia sorghi TaxID=27349 RepID=A0A0L6UM58_9BASI|nr:uncharacterized protein VP01_48g1 [Puccinia sorghi]